MDRKRAIKQLNKIKNLAKEIRLAADSWEEDWKTLIAILLSARTRDKVTIPVAENLFNKYGSLEKLAMANYHDVKRIINSVNYSNVKARKVIGCAKMLLSLYNGRVPNDFNKLVELPGIGRKSANVFLAEKGYDRIGVDTHVAQISRKLGWTKHKNPALIERDLERLFPRKMWREINWILVRFGQSYTNKREKNLLLEKINQIKD